MTSKRQKNAGWLLPEQLTGHDLLCLTIPVPDVREYRAALFGALKSLTEWWNWEKSYEQGDTRASQAAAYWRELLLDIEIQLCGGGELSPFDVRQNGQYPCKLEKTEDGVEWVEWANLQLCPPRLARTPGGDVLWFNPDTGLWEALEENTEYDPRNYPVNQPVSGGECVAAWNAAAALRALYDAIFQADFFAAVNATAAAGMMTTGITMLIGVSVTAGLLVPIAVLILGALTSGLIGRFTTDIEKRLRCIISGHLASDGTLAIPADSFNAILSEVFTESGTDVAWLGVWYLLQAVGEAGLASSLAIDAPGEDDCGCLPFCRDFDLLPSQDGWTRVPYVNPDKGVWISGVGFAATGGISGQREKVKAKIDFSPRLITRVEMTLTVSSSTYWTIRNETTGSIWAQGTVGAGSWVMSGTGGAFASGSVSLEVDTAPSSSARITAARIEGAGVDPFTTGTDCLEP